MDHATLTVDLFSIFMRYIYDQYMKWQYDVQMVHRDTLLETTSTITYYKRICIVQHLNNFGIKHRIFTSMPHIGTMIAILTTCEICL